MKRHVILYVAWLLMVCFCLTLIGCAGGNVGTSAAEPTRQGSQHGSSSSDQAYTNQSEKTESAQEPNRPDETGRYRHEIDGIVFYTEHDVEQWITRIEGGRRIFDLDKMVKDILGEDAYAGNGRAWWNNGHSTFAFGNANHLTGSTNDYPLEGYSPYISINTTDFLYDLGNGEKEYYLPVYFFSNEPSKKQATDYELIEIALYACEMWAKEETRDYNFENFAGSERIMFIDR